MLSTIPEAIARTAPHAAAYVRVSTSRQADYETSLVDQVAAITSYCEARGIELVEVFREPGASATDDNRPQFRAMIEAAIGRERPFEMMIIHSFSRFFRDQSSSSATAASWRKRRSSWSPSRWTWEKAPLAIWSARS